MKIPLIICIAALFPGSIFSQGTWGSDVRLTTHSAAQRTRIWDNGRNVVVDSQDRIYITWMDEREGDSDIYLRKFENGVWQTEILVTSNESYQSDSRNPSLMVRPGDPNNEWPEQIWIGWVDNPGTQSLLRHTKHTTRHTSR